MTAYSKNTFTISGSSVSIEDETEFKKHYPDNRETWEKAFEWLMSTDLGNINTGRYDLDEDKLFVVVSEYSTKPANEIMFEAHRKYIDIQYVVSGSEMIGVAGLNYAREKVPYNDEKDIAFYEIQESDCRYYQAGPDKFFIFFPTDAHKPGISIDENIKVRKVVVKLRI